MGQSSVWCEVLGSAKSRFNPNLQGHQHPSCVKLSLSPLKHPHMRMHVHRAMVAAFTLDSVPTAAEPLNHDIERAPSTSAGST